MLLGWPFWGTYLPYLSKHSRWSWSSRVSREEVAVAKEKEIRRTGVAQKCGSSKAGKRLVCRVRMSWLIKISGKGWP